MYGLMYFDTEDFFSAPDEPVHRLPFQFAEIMAKYGMKGCFHIHPEKARFMERHGHHDVIAALRKHDVSSHFDRGSIHPTTAEEVSSLGWFEGVDRTMFRELPGFQALERILGRCTALTKHGGTFAAQIVFAAGRLGKPFFASPFEVEGRAVHWFCNNLILSGGSGGSFDREYKDTAKFEEKLAQQNEFLLDKMGKVDLVCLFGCHPLITIMEEFPCGLNFKAGASPKPEDWQAPTMIPGVSIPTIMANFERRIAGLADFPGLEWTTVAGIARRYSQRPVLVSDDRVLEGARAVVDNGGPTFTDVLTAGELLCLLARRRLAPASAHPVPQVMGPVSQRSEAVRSLVANADLDRMSREIIGHVWGSGYLPECLSRECGFASMETAIVLLACDAVGAEPASIKKPALTVDAIPGVPAATQHVEGDRNWRQHGALYNQENIVRHFRSQAWTFKPAFEAREYGPGIEIGSYLNSAFPFPMRTPAGETPEAEVVTNE